jgi:hypothetical protein
MQTEAQRRSEYLVNLAKLRETPAFAWFMEKCVGEMHKSAEKQLHNTRNVTPEQREIAAHVVELLGQILEWPEDQFTRNNGEKPPGGA